MKKISLIIPCYNEEGCLPAFDSEIAKVVERMPEYEFEILFVNDGSVDGTLPLIRVCRKTILCPLPLVFQEFWKRGGHVCGIYERHGRLCGCHGCRFAGPSRTSAKDGEDFGKRGI